MNLLPLDDLLHHGGVTPGDGASGTLARWASEDDVGLVGVEVLPVVELDDRVVLVELLGGDARLEWARCVHRPGPTRL
ncbi:hypothetical protein ACTJIY_20115, partial [Cellulosimicrobium sp. 22598]